MACSMGPPSGLLDGIDSFFYRRIGFVFGVPKVWYSAFVFLPRIDI